MNTHAHLDGGDAMFHAAICCDFTAAITASLAWNAQQARRRDLEDITVVRQSIGAEWRMLCQERSHPSGSFAWVALFRR
jgi:hypothetical protein